MSSTLRWVSITSITSGNSSGSYCSPTITSFDSSCSYCSLGITRCKGSFSHCSFWRRVSRRTLWVGLVSRRKSRRPSGFWRVMTPVLSPELSCRWTEVDTLCVPDRLPGHRINNDARWQKCVKQPDALSYCHHRGTRCIEANYSVLRIGSPSSRAFCDILYQNSLDTIFIAVLLSPCILPWPIQALGAVGCSLCCLCFYNA